MIRTISKRDKAIGRNDTFKQIRKIDQSVVTVYLLQPRSILQIKKSLNQRFQFCGNTSSIHKRNTVGVVIQQHDTHYRDYILDFVHVRTHTHTPIKLTVVYYPNKGIQTCGYTSVVKTGDQGLWNERAVTKKNHKPAIWWNYIWKESQFGKIIATFFVFFFFPTTKTLNHSWITLKI